MRHQVAGYKLGRSKAARVALRRNLIKQFFTHERIRTTRAKAAAIRGEAERLITIARNSAEGSDSEKIIVPE
jgi:large subunit ribosomal protein L17